MWIISVILRSDRFCRPGWHRLSLFERPKNYTPCPVVMWSKPTSVESNQAFSWVDRDITAHGSFSDFVALIRSQPHTVELFVVTAWLLWTWCNKLRLGEDVLRLNRFSELTIQYSRAIQKWLLILSVSVICCIQLLVILLKILYLILCKVSLSLILLGKVMQLYVLSRRKNSSFLLLVWMESDSLDIATVFYADLPTAWIKFHFQAVSQKKKKKKIMISNDICWLA